MTADSKQSQRDDESVLSRWSRRKLESRKEPGDEQPPAAETFSEPPGKSPPIDDRAVEQDEPPVLTDTDMPDIDTLDENSDFSVFMSRGVSDKLRNLALRKLFGAPVFNIRDGLDEYDEDYTSFEKLGDIVTCDMKHHIEMEQQRLREKLAEEQRAEESVEVDETEAVDDEPRADDEQPATPGDEKLARAEDAAANPNHDAEDDLEDER